MLFHFKLLARPVVDYHAAANGSTVHCDTIYNPPWDLQAHNTHFFFFRLKGYTNGFSTSVLSNKIFSPLVGNVL